MSKNMERRIGQARVALLLGYPFYGHLAIGLELVEKRDMMIPTMATDGKYLYYDPDFVESLQLGELMGVIAHEVTHCALNHLGRRHNREQIRWNLATDFSSNDLIVKDTYSGKLKLPKGCLIPGITPGTKDFEGKYAEYIYNQLPEPTYIEVSWGTMDSHEEWSGWDAGKGNGGKDEDKNGKCGPPEKGQGKDEKDKGSDEEEEGGMEQQWRERVAQAATVARMAGKMPGHWDLIVGDLLQPKLDWKAILRDMITSCAKSDFRISPPNKKHIWRGFYLPSLQGEEIRIAVVLDTSGSISDDEIKEFLSEVKGICEAYEDYTIWLFTCDTEIHNRFELHPFDTLPKVVSGRGGTDFTKPIEEAGRLPISTLVYLTDLYPNNGFPKQPFYPVIWVSVSDVVPPWGQLIKLPREKR